MRPPVIRGHVWRVVRVSPGDPFLMDRTGTMRLATSDFGSRTIRISSALPVWMFDRVLVHEVAHAVMAESGLSDLLAEASPSSMAEEMLAWFTETHGAEVMRAVTDSLGRGVCLNGTCLEVWHATD